MADKNLELGHPAVSEYSWKDVSVTVLDRHTKQKRLLIDNITGYATAGELLALMGPSGSGKTTLLNVLAHREATKGGHLSGSTYVNHAPISKAAFRHLSAFVEQEDALIGSLTVDETMEFAAKLSLGRSVSKTERKMRIEELLTSFGLENQKHALVGSALRKGISGGQKRRLSVAAQLIGKPSILLLDEPTSGLDSVASFEVIKFIKDFAQTHGLIVVVSIHQPSNKTFELFDKLLLLADGKTCYNGERSELLPWLADLNLNVPQHVSPIEFALDLVNSDFGSTHARLLQEACCNAAQTAPRLKKGSDSIYLPNETSRSAWHATLVLLQRSWIKSYRDIVAYWIRVVMYAALGVLMGTVWLRLPAEEQSIQPFISAIFFGGAFMSFMAVAYVPAVIEDITAYQHEHANGLYGPVPFVISNSLIGIPYLFGIALLFSMIAYWLSNLVPTAHSFGLFVMWLFLDLLAAEAMVLLLSSLFPIFVVALALSAFANGLWMCVSGFLVPLPQLNVFWKYVFHYIDYQAYVFQGMMANEFGNRFYKCSSAACSFPTNARGMIDGEEVLRRYGIADGRFGLRIGIVVAITVVLRLLSVVVLYLRKSH
ncbi:putative ABC transporter [Protomyces lactucae-debilis]|uniref:Putative ABC transporter n=1 Tax=Protomyces lactucae-debilis TaxID=2754530 RepID=A0A1Y2FUH7_PROLT|nr:putative ABC transporter [Protomyces lactucae-debilis]ORY87663.1 putative ABC transporter [Protomyces lactucae-debilis]